jgi:hypothetical protein
MKVTFEHEEIEELILAEAIRIGIKVNYCNLKGTYGNCTAELEWVDPPEAAPILMPPPPPTNTESL